MLIVYATSMLLWWWWYCDWMERKYNRWYCLSCGWHIGSKCCNHWNGLRHDMVHIRTIHGPAAKSVLSVKKLKILLPAGGEFFRLDWAIILYVWSGLCASGYLGVGIGVRVLGWDVCGLVGTWIVRCNCVSQVPYRGKYLMPSQEHGPMQVM